MSSPALPLRIEACNCFAARKTARQITRLYDSHLQPTGLRITQFLILAALQELGIASVNTLAAHLDVERTAMGKMLGFLERDGLLTLQPSPTDGRSKQAELTKQGEATCRTALPLWQAAQAEFGAMMGPEAMRTLRRGFAKVDTLSD